MPPVDLKARIAALKKHQCSSCGFSDEAWAEIQGWNASIDRVLALVGEEPPAEKVDLNALADEIAESFLWSENTREAERASIVPILQRLLSASPRVGAPQDDSRVWTWQCTDCNAWTINEGRGQFECGKCGVIKPFGASLMLFHYKLPTKVHGRVGAEPSPETQTRTNEKI